MDTVNGCYMNGNTFVEPDQDQGLPERVPICNLPKHHFYGPHHHHHHHGPIILNHPPLINATPCRCGTCQENIHCDHYLKPTIIDGCCCDDDYIKPDPPNRLDIPNILNIETKLLVSLQITLYGVKEEDDVTLILSEGKQYTVYYLTEKGIFKATGHLKKIDKGIPLRECQYIGNTSDIAKDAYIILDCSTIGNSDIVKIYINSIRYIEEVVEETEDNTTNEDELTPDDGTQEDNINGGTTEESNNEEGSTDNKETNITE